MKVFEIGDIEDNKLFEENDDIVFNDLLESLNNTKCLIDKEPKKWNDCKKCINDYEYIYTSSFSRKNICAKKPISRSYFKILEIIKWFKIKDFKKIDCLAEAPGGFIEYFTEKKCNINTISLISKETSIPHWNNYIIKNDKINILSGKDNTGDIYKLENIFDYVKNSGMNSSDIVTGDGGFDYTLNFSNQELDSYSLIYSEVVMALLLLKRGGTFICKIFDILYLRTIKLLYILKKRFKNIYIVKPSMSRKTNSEKYVVCIEYTGYNYKIMNIMIHNFHKELKIKVPKLFIDKLNDFNKSYISEQIYEIKKGVNVRKEDITNSPSKTQLIIGEKWCVQNDLEINKTFFRDRLVKKR